MDIFIYEVNNSSFYKNKQLNRLVSSGDLIVFAFDNKKIGIDVQKIAPLDISPVGFLSEKQMHFFNNFKKNKLIYFYYIWTLKESLIKMIGLDNKLLTTPMDLKQENFYSFLYKDYVISVCNYCNLNDVINEDILFS